MKRNNPFAGFRRGMGIGGWLTNYKRFHVLPEVWRHTITVGDLEHFESYITEDDIRRIASWGMDHIRLGFDQIVLESSPGIWREPVFRKIEEFLDWCGKYHLHVVLNLHKAIGNCCDISEPVSLLEDEALQKRFIALWLELERRWHQRDSVAFELLNEVHDVPPELWNNLALRTIEAIRKVNPGRRIIVGSTCWNAPRTLSALPRFDDPAIACAFHFCEPFEFTHPQGGYFKRDRSTATAKCVIRATSALIGNIGNSSATTLPGMTDTTGSTAPTLPESCAPCSIFNGNAPKRLSGAASSVPSVTAAWSTGKTG